MENHDLNHDKKGFYVLRRTYSDLFRRSAYNYSKSPIIDRIIEYDIRSANTTMLRRARKVKERDLKALEALPKHQREVIVGNMIKQDKEIGKTIRKGIIQAKRMLFEANNIQSDEVQAIRNDAVFIIGRRLKATTFGSIEFVQKGVYSMYMKVEGIHFYYDKANQTVDVKGIKDEIVEEEDHQNGMVKFMSTVMGYLCMNRRDALRKYLIEFTDNYKSMKLPLCYYREFGKLNAYRSKMEISGYSFCQGYVSESDRDMIDGTYNYKRFVLPIIQQYM